MEFVCKREPCCWENC